MTNTPTTPPATERVPWREAIDRIAPASSYGPEKLLDHPAAIDYRMEDGMVEVLVEAPAGDDVPQADTPTPEGRWVTVYVGDKERRPTPHWETEDDLLDPATDKLPPEAWDALVDLVRRDGTAPTPHEVSSRVAHQVNNGSTESLRLIALRSILDEEGPEALVDAVLAAVRALRAGATR